MAVEIETEESRRLVAKVLDELNRSEVVHQSAAELMAETDLTDSARRPRKSSVERETMLRQLPVQ